MLEDYLPKEIIEKRSEKTIMFSNPKSNDDPLAQLAEPPSAEVRDLINHNRVTHLCLSDWLIVPIQPDPQYEGLRFFKENLGTQEYPVFSYKLQWYCRRNNQWKDVGIQEP